MTEQISQTLADCLDAIDSGKKTVPECLEVYPELAQELEPLLEVAKELSIAGQINPRRQFQETAHARIVSQLPSRRPGLRFAHQFQHKIQTTSLKHRQYFQPWVVALIVLIAIATLGTGTVFASSQALPGDWLYPVKLNVEQVRYTLAPPGQKVGLILKYLDERRSEITTLENSKRYKDLPQAVSKLEGLSNQLIDQFSQEVENQVSDKPENVGTINSSLSNNVQVLNRVLDNAPDPAKPAIEHAIQMTQKNDKDFQDILNGKSTHQRKNQPGITVTATSEPTQNQQKPKNTHQPDNPGGGNNPATNNLNNGNKPNTPVTGKN